MEYRLLKSVGHRSEYLQVLAVHALEDQIYERGDDWGVFLRSFVRGLDDVRGANLLPDREVPDPSGRVQARELILL